MRFHSSWFPRTEWHSDTPPLRLRGFSRRLGLCCVHTGHINPFFKGTPVGVLSINYAFLNWKIADLQAHIAPPGGAILDCRSAILKNHENVPQILNIFTFRANILTQIFASGEVTGTTYLQMGVGSLLHIIFGCPWQEIYQHHWYRNMRFLSGFRRHF